MSLVGRAPSITPVARRDRNKGGCSLSPDRVGKCCSHLAGIREISRRSAAPRLTPRHRAGFISDRLIGIGLLPLFSHLHTPPPFSPSLISLVVSVDVKHHVYLLMGLLPLFLPPSLPSRPPPVFLLQKRRPGSQIDNRPLRALVLETSWTVTGPWETYIVLRLADDAL